MKNTYVWVAVLLIIIIGGFWYMQGGSLSLSKGDMGEYAYVCENGSQFSMTPSADVSEITLTAGSQGMFTGTVTLVKMGDGAHFETTSGTLITFGGAGEEVQFSVGNESTVCNPVPNSEMAPWNWGDAGEGSGMQPDVRLVVGESIMGKWQSTEDAKFVREFKDFSETGLSGTVVDRYGNEDVSSGTYVVFTKENPIQVSFPIEDSTPYLQLTMAGTQSEKLNFKVVKLTPDVLELVYMDRGGALIFKSVK